MPKKKKKELEPSGHPTPPSRRSLNSHIGFRRAEFYLSPVRRLYARSLPLTPPAGSAGSSSQCKPKPEQATPGNQRRKALHLHPRQRQHQATAKVIRRTCNESKVGAGQNDMPLSLTVQMEDGSPAQGVSERVGTGVTRV
ncbi:hypothetical protein MAPG_04310 [Magnaporthiopsis poae ATCC 64411]|uniref:Uncharacterized protein n=1 Tax=Magnaporthiopsis poae (strain ATCC 64411 / 73-15) TaxID=644358 RepID=A0A0C4DWD4_MAGP6|nr:hypothetical protein MAPG_04310 [Magnaporthiopsis poae ATCC 64411]